MALIMDQWMVEVGSIRPDSIDFDLRTTLGEARSSVARMAGESQNDLDTLFDPAIPSPCRGDPSRLRQIILGLAGFLMCRVRGDIIQWQCTREGDDENEMTLRVSFATTPGRVDPEVVRQAFDMGGLGVGADVRLLSAAVGLYHARLLARILGGDAGSEQNADRTLLWARVVLQKRRAEAAHSEASTGRRVLLVSSSPKEVDMLVGALRESGWDARGATTQDEALTILRDSANTGQPYGIILVTFVLPDGGADHLAREAFSILGAARVHIVLLADVGRPGDAKWAHSLGCSAYVVRPLNTRTLDKVLSELLSHSQKRGGDTRGLFVTRHSLAERNQRSRWVLVVEDDAVTRLSIMNIVRSLGHQPYGAESASEALGLCDRAQFDLILMDIRLPGLDGDQVSMLVRSRERTSGQPPAVIIGMTSTPEPEDRQRCLASGMNDLFIKPMGVDTIRSIVDSMKEEEPLLYVWQPPEARPPDPEALASASEARLKKTSLANIMGLVSDSPSRQEDDAADAAAA